MRNRAGDSVTKSEQGVQSPNTASQTIDLSRLKWDDIRLFRGVAAAGSLRGAASEFGVSVNTVRARIERLERDVARTLVARTPNGIRLTDEGRGFLEASRAMGDAARRKYTTDEEDVLVTAGQLTVGCSEGIGILWLTPRLATLKADLPRLTVNLAFDYNLARDRVRECDVWLTYDPPAEQDIIVSKLATVHFLAFASPAYLQRHGAPATVDDLKRHSLVEHVAPGVRSELLDYLIGTDRPEGLIALRTNSSLAQLWAVTEGVGIGGLPTFVHEITRSVRAISPELRIRRELWLAYRPEAKGSPSVRTAIDWLRDAFDPSTYPCFSGDFVHPNEMAARGSDKNVVSLFAGPLDHLPQPPLSAES